jgi:hypothetical protein
MEAMVFMAIAATMLVMALWTLGLIGRDLYTGAAPPVQDLSFSSNGLVGRALKVGKIYRLHSRDRCPRDRASDQGRI